MPGRMEDGFVMTSLLGIVGACVGGFVGTSLGFGKVTGFNLPSFFIAVLGACLLYTSKINQHAVCPWQNLLQPLGYPAVRLPQGCPQEFCKAKNFGKGHIHFLLKLGSACGGYAVLLAAIAVCYGLLVVLATNMTIRLF